MDNDFATGYALGADGDRHNDGMFGGNGWWAIIIFAMIFGWGGFGGRNGAMDGALTRSDICNEFGINSLQRGVQGVQQGLCDGFYSQNTTMLTGFSSLGNQIADNRFASQQCCCETNRNIDAVRAENYRNTCDITTAIHQEAEATRALINANTMQDLRDRLEARDRDLLSANFQLSQLSQTQSLVNELRPVSRPAYITCSPYQSAFGWNGNCGCGNSCC